MTRRNSLPTLTTIACTILTLVAGNAMAGQRDTVLRVWKGRMLGWHFINDQDQTPCFTPECELDTLATAVGNVGTALLQVSDVQTFHQRSMVYAPLLRGTRLASLSTLEYVTYVERTDRYVDGLDFSALAPILIIDVDFDLADSDTSAQGRLVFDPALQVTDGRTFGFGGRRPENIELETWQTWNTIAGGSAVWYLSGAPASVGTWCSELDPCTLSQILNEFPRLGVHKTLGGIGIYVGASAAYESLWTNAHVSGHVDKVTVSITRNHRITYDFDAQGPLSKSDCYAGGWEGYFENQGACVSYFQQQTTPPGHDDDKPGVGCSQQHVRHHADRADRYAAWAEFYRGRDRQKAAHCAAKAAYHAHKATMPCGGHSDAADDDDDDRNEGDNCCDRHDRDDSRSAHTGSGGNAGGGCSHTRG